MHIGHHGIHIALDLCVRHGEQGEGAITKGCRSAQRNQCVHVGRTVPQTLEPADKKLLIDDHNDHRQQQLQKPHCHMVAVEKRGQRPAPHHVPHGNVHQYDPEAQRSEEPFFQHRGFPVF